MDYPCLLEGLGRWGRVVRHGLLGKCRGFQSKVGKRLIFRIFYVLEPHLGEGGGRRENAALPLRSEILKLAAVRLFEFQLAAVNRRTKVA